MQDARGPELKARREAAGISLRQLGAQLGVTGGRVYVLERGDHVLKEATVERYLLALEAARARRYEDALRTLQCGLSGLWHALARVLADAEGRLAGQDEGSDPRRVDDNEPATAGEGGKQLAAPTR